MASNTILRTFLIDVAGKLLLDGQFWADVKLFVKEATAIDDPTLSKEENNKRKHENVKSRLTFIFGNIGETLLDWAIKFGVLYLKSLEK